jgi:hypothetical protein
MDNPNVEAAILKNFQKKFVVNTVRVEGVVNTDHRFLESVTWPLLEAKTLQEIVIGSKNIADKLRQFGIFKSIDVTLDSPKGMKGSVDVICILI